MSKQYTTIQGNIADRSRPAERPPKTNWKLELMKRVLRVAQYPAPNWVAGRIWAQFTRPGYVPIKDKYEALIAEAHTYTTDYQGQQLMNYRWGAEDGPKVLLSHGWRSKIADFRRLIGDLVKAGYTVEGVDFPAHGKSEGRNTALPEFREILNAKYRTDGPYEAVIGYSIGGLGASLMVTDLPEGLQPKHLFMLAAPPFARYFFRDITDSLKLGDRVYHAFCNRVEAYYQQPIDSFDLRERTEKLAGVDTHLIYDVDDETIPFFRGENLAEGFPEASFVKTTGLGHYKIIAFEGVREYILQQIKQEEAIEA